MRIIPAIHIQNGMAVRLYFGKQENEKIYGHPKEFALRWQGEGADMLHIIDLDAAFTGEFKNKQIIMDLVRELKIPIQLGGGARTKDAIKERLESVGASRVVLGTVAVEDEGLLIWAKTNFSDRLVVGIDACDGQVVTRGWVEQTDRNAIDLASRVRELGIDTVVYTDTVRDDLNHGPNVEQIEKMVRRTWMNILVSGGLFTLEDVAAVRDSGAYGALIGTALYDGKFTLREAIAVRK